MFGGMVVMFVGIIGGEGILMWLIWKRLAAHLKDNPEGVAALTTHLFVPLLGKKAPSGVTETDRDARQE